jgi:hypothetical protein
VDATQEKYREASSDGADGVVVQDQTEMFLNLNHHPYSWSGQSFQIKQNRNLFIIIRASRRANRPE